MLRREVRIFFTALMFYTRIPCPKWIDHDPQFINLSIRYFPLVGWIVGMASAVVFYLVVMFLSAPVAIVFSIAASILVTGGLHEDGFADACDAFGGGWTKEKILLIMKDSRLGTYGVIGLVLILGLKTMLLVEFTNLATFSLVEIGLFFIIGHSLSRFIAATFIFTHEYARDTNDSKAKPVAEQTSYRNLFMGSIWVIVPVGLWCLYFQSYWILPIFIFTYISKYFLARYFNKWIGGYTGDCLGATQQVVELIAYIFMILIWKSV